MDQSDSGSAGIFSQWTNRIQRLATLFAAMFVLLSQPKGASASIQRKADATDAPARKGGENHLLHLRRALVVRALPFSRGLRLRSRLRLRLRLRAWGGGGGVCGKEPTDAIKSQRMLLRANGCY
eukprot:925852-Prorocentrum_minimum.AAC.1